jgi:hypothetical protein
MLGAYLDLWEALAEATSSTGGEAGARKAGAMTGGNR